MPERKKHFEVWSAGIDEDLQGVAGDPWGTIGFTGLRIPTLATPDPQHRYLFMLGGFELGERSAATIVGWRQLLTLGIVVSDQEDTPKQALIELPITNPIFRLSDFNVQWGLYRLDQNHFSLVAAQQAQAPVRPQVNNLAFLFSSQPALLYDHGTIVPPGGFYTKLTAYVPPYNGQPPGAPIAHLRVVNDLRTPWLSANAWRSLDLEVEGPGFYYLAASVAQTSGAFAAVLADFATALNATPGLDEYRFLANFSGLGVSSSSPIPWRIGGALDVKIHDKGT